MSEYTPRQKKIDLALLIILPSILGYYAICSFNGQAFTSVGDSYLFMTQVLCAIVAMVCPLLRLKNIIRLPYWFIAVVTSVLYIHAIMLYYGFYQSISWWDAFTHYYSSFVVSMVVFTALLMIDKYIDSISLQPVLVLHLLTFFIGFGFGSIWEVMEWMVDTLCQQPFMQYSVFDTLGDLRVDLLGALTMAVVSAIILHFKSVEEIVGDMGLDEKIDALKAAWVEKHGN